MIHPRTADQARPAGSVEVVSSISGRKTVKQ